jgi:ferredoxin
MTFLVINPDRCIDCGGYVPECLDEAIFAVSDPADTADRLQFNPAPHKQISEVSS